VAVGHRLVLVLARLRSPEPADHWEADDIERALKHMAVSEDPFDRWFRDKVRDVHGMNVEDGFPPPEQVLDLRSS
jgi:hypothetical protein